MQERTTDGTEIWRSVARFEELPDDGTGITVELEGTVVAVFRVGEHVHVMEDSCPHAGASLGCGMISGTDVTCPWHSWHFDLRSGVSSDGLDERVTVYPARLTDAGEVEALLGAS